MLLPIAVAIMVVIVAIIVLTRNEFSNISLAEYDMKILVISIRAKTIEFNFSNRVDLYIFIYLDFSIVLATLLSNS